MKLNNFLAIEQFLTRFVPSKPGAYKLERMEKLMQLLGSPQEKLSIIHIAGTSGKTSTAYYASSLLSQAGVKVGLTVSPHVFEINERVQINNQPLPESKFCTLFNKFINIQGVIDSRPTYFELLVAFAYWAFLEQGCTHAVIEVGLGGLLDGTNVIQNPNKVAVITDIGLDHISVLGNTINEIAIQKAGIIKPHNTVISYFQDEEIQDVILQACSQNHAIFHRIDYDECSEGVDFISSIPEYQKRNWLLAKQVVSYIATRDNTPIITKNQLLESQAISIPARMEVVKIKDHEVIIDGAHNPQKLQALCESLKNLHPDAKISALIAFAGTKSDTLRDSLMILNEIVDEIIVTEFSISEDYAHSSLSCDEVARVAKEVGFRSIISEADTDLAIQRFIQTNSDVKLITGSFYLIASLKNNIERVV